MATHSGILAWKIPWTEDLSGLGPRGCKQSDMTEQQAHTHLGSGAVWPLFPQ